jgi:hypothetical protein
LQELSLERRRESVDGKEKDKEERGRERCVGRENSAGVRFGVDLVEMDE